MMRYRSVLITGAGGFVGRHLVDTFLAMGKRVIALDNFSASDPRVLSSYKKKITIIRGDIRDRVDVARAIKTADVVMHMAAIRSVALSVEDPKTAHEVNSTGTLNLLEQARQSRVKHFVFASTSAVYGDNLRSRQSESLLPRPISPYGIAKLAAESYAGYYWLQWRLPTTSFRIFNVYGPRQNPESRYSLLVPGILEKLQKNQSPVIDGDGSQVRDFVYIQDVVDAFLKSLGRKAACGESFNLGSGRTYSINSVVKKLIHLSGKKVKPIYGPRRPADPMRTCADIRKASKVLGWSPRVGIDMGLKNCVHEYFDRKNYKL